MTFHTITRALITAALAAKAAAATQIIVSVPDQRLALIRDGQVLSKYKISTSRFGIGDSHGSYNTPLGKLAIADKIGAGRPEGTVFKGRHATKEILKPNAPGRDPIVTRILHLRGLESHNDNAFGRGIYIHGTPVERTLGKADSYGCVRMRSRDIIELFDRVEEGTTVEIVNEDLTRSAAWYAATHPAPPALPAVAETARIVAKTSPQPAATASATPAAPIARPQPRFTIHGGPLSKSLNKSAIEALGPAEPETEAHRKTAGGFTFGKLTF